MVLDSERRYMGQTARFQDTLRRLAMIDEGFVEDQAGLRFGLAETSALGNPSRRGGAASISPLNSLIRVTS